MNDPKDIITSLEAIFPGHVVDLECASESRLRFRIGNGETQVQVHFQDLPRIATALGTENLNFGQTAGDPGYSYSEYTYQDPTPGWFFVEGWD